MSGVIYNIKSAATGRVYVGSTTRSPRQRWLEHLHYLRKGTHHSKHLQRVYCKYGETDLDFSVVYECQPDEVVLDCEQRHIDAVAKTCMNTAPVSDSIYAAHAANRGRVIGQDERRIRSEAAKLAIAEGRVKPQKWSEERRAKHSIALTGRKMPPVSLKTRENIGAALRLRNALAGHRAKEKTPNAKTAFIASEIESWVDMRKRGMSYREMERVTGRCRSVLSRECQKVLA